MISADHGLIQKLGQGDSVYYSNSAHTDDSTEVRVFFAAPLKTSSPQAEGHEKAYSWLNPTYLRPRFSADGGLIWADRSPSNRGAI